INRYTSSTTCFEVCNECQYIYDNTICAHCKEKFYCRFQTFGICTSECDEGWTGTMCNDCVPGRWGPICARCGECLNNGFCNLVNGTCPESKCNPGFHGSTCLHSCSDGSYGINCMSKCGQCKFPPCDVRTGFCQQDVCVNGYTGIYCDTPCPAGRDGPNCTFSCNKNCVGGKCDPGTGHCTQGCVENWSGEKCDVCSAGKFGPTCSYKCSGNCENGDDCDPKTGNCPNAACADGWTGPQCLTPCSTSKRSYGPNCTLTCSENCNGDALCNHVTGKCTQGCVKNWTGDKCEECVNGLYGIRCDMKCIEKCRNDENCDAKDGNCTNDCEEGYSGEKCDLFSSEEIVVSPKTTIIFTSVVIAIAFPFTIGLTLCLVWNLRLRRRQKSQENQLPQTTQQNLPRNDFFNNLTHEQPLPQNVSQTTHQNHLWNGDFFNRPTRTEFHTPQLDSVIYDEIPEDAEYLKIVETTPKSSLDSYLEPIPASQSKGAVATSDQSQDVVTLVAHFGPSALQPAIPINPGDVGSPYADVLNLADGKMVGEYEYIRHDDGSKI
ncbi:hypothetical protein B566_EDAN017231, partial [Ephemera danica]